MVLQDCALSRGTSTKLRQQERNQISMNRMSSAESSCPPVLPDTLTVAPGCITILENPDTPIEQTAALARELMTPSMDATMMAATVGNEIHRQNIVCGMQENMIITPTPVIIIDRRGVRSAQDGLIVDVPYTDGI